MKPLSSPRCQPAYEAGAGATAPPVQRRDPPLHVLVSRWLAAGWDVAPDLLEEAAVARAAERSQLRDPLTADEFIALIGRIAEAEDRRYARWLWRVCDTDEPDSLHGTLEAMFMGKHSFLRASAAGDELLNALEDLVKWRMHFNDHEVEPTL